MKTTGLLAVSDCATPIKSFFFFQKTFCEFAATCCTQFNVHPCKEGLLVLTFTAFFSKILHSLESRLAVIPWPV